jgi:hypothetical protein
MHRFGISKTITDRRKRKYRFSTRQCGTFRRTEMATPGSR